VTIAMMLASAIQAALAGRPEQILDAVKEGAREVFASAITLTVIDVLIRLTDEASAMVWQPGRGDLKTMIERIVAVASVTGPLTHTFVGRDCCTCWLHLASSTSTPERNGSLPPVPMGWFGTTPAP
jgi:hypothetical protein